MVDENSTAWTGLANDATASASIEGEVDFTNSLAVREWLRDFCDRTTGDVLLDLGKLAYIDSSGLAIMIEIRKYLVSRNRRVRITQVSEQVHKLFSLTQTGEMFGI